jgi:hypothetical protein
VSDILNRVLPILVLLAIGAWARRVRFISESTVADLRKIVVNFALPAVLFTAFREVEFTSSDIALVAATLVSSVGLYGLGRMLQPRFAPQHEYFPFLMTGFEAGMLGISLFGSAYGLDKVGFFDRLPDARSARTLKLLHSFPGQRRVACCLNAVTTCARRSNQVLRRNQGY